MKARLHFALLYIVLGCGCAFCLSFMQAHEYLMHLKCISWRILRNFNQFLKFRTLNLQFSSGKAVMEKYNAFYVLIMSFVDVISRAGLNTVSLETHPANLCEGVTKIYLLSFSPVQPCKAGVCQIMALICLKLSAVAHLYFR